MSELSAEQVISLLDLKPHELEGGYFRETWRSADRLPAGIFESRYPSQRCASTAIYYLLTPGSFSHLHSLPTEEVFHFYLGDAVEMLNLYPDGSGRIIELGSDLAAGQIPQWVVEANTWQGCRLKEGGKLALLGCTVAPGFEFEDYRHGSRSLAEQYSSYSDQIDRLCL